MRREAMPDEIRKPAEEYTIAPELMSPAPETVLMPPENAPAPPEFEGPIRAQESTEDREKRGSRLRRQLLRTVFTPVAAVVATLAVVYASFGFDPLGNDFLMEGSPKSEVENVKKAGEEKKSKPPTPTPTPAVTPTPMPQFLPGVEGSISYAVPLVWTQYHVEGENGESYESPLEENSINDVYNWLDTWGGSHSLTETNRERVFLGYMFSDDAIPIGDMDDLANLYLAQGTMYAVYREDVYVNASYGTPSPTPAGIEGDDNWPVMTNLAPDLVGAYSGSGQSEQFIRFRVSGENDYRYLVIGDAWIGMGGSLSEMDGASYDASTNTLTLTDCTADILDVNLMGNGFTIELVGDNSIDHLIVWGYYYGGSVTFTGTGTLTINRDRTNSAGLTMNAEWSPTAVFVDSGVDITIYGADAAILICSTTMDKAVYFRKKSRMTGGTGKSGQFSTYSRPLTDEDGYVLFDENGNPMYEEITLDQIYEMYGERYYDYTICDEDGNPAKEVHFTDPNR